MNVFSIIGWSDEMNRIERVSSEMRHTICDIIQKEIKDPHVGFVTITEVKVTADLQIAKVYFTVLGDEKQKKESYDTLKRSAGFIRKQLASRLNMRHTPVLDFRQDKAVEYNSKIDEIFKKLENECHNKLMRGENVA